MLLNVIGIRLKFVRNCLTISQKEFAKFLDIPLNTYIKWEQCKNSPDIRNLIKIADKICVPLDWLVGREKMFVLYNCKAEDIIKEIYKINKNKFL